MGLRAPHHKDKTLQATAPSAKGVSLHISQLRTQASSPRTGRHVLNDTLAEATSASAVAKSTESPLVWKGATCLACVPVTYTIT